MNIADQYAKALYDVALKNPGNAEAYGKNLYAALRKRGHEKLLPRILKSYEHLEMNTARKMNRARVTPEQRRTRTLVELYKKLISA